MMSQIVVVLKITIKQNVSHLGPFEIYVMIPLMSGTPALII